ATATLQGAQLFGARIVPRSPLMRAFLAVANQLPFGRDPLQTAMLQSQIARTLSVPVEHIVLAAVGTGGGVEALSAKLHYCYQSGVRRSCDVTVARVTALDALAALPRIALPGE